MHGSKLLIMPSWLQGIIFVLRGIGGFVPSMLIYWISLGIAIALSGFVMVDWFIFSVSMIVLAILLDAATYIVIRHVQCRLEVEQYFDASKSK
ncbi:MAG: hypothetical protein DRJ26_01585 [Candidatus Methanomethylicota archaeon]|uniref:Uncharacterized protein n=2 Tax=Thermoproteota archaeon TaxID=2056631 RepID=A0A497F5N8_9CREN|nr:MAG: hypothetical protein DRJ26_01585 [Candidatus Verstraetearchaeota archaeon]